MSYCLNPQCHRPHNTHDGKFCQTCGSKLLLKERYRAIKPIGQGGFGKTFLAVDEDKPSKPYCVIKQFYPQIRGTTALQKATELFNQEAVRLEHLGEHPQIPDLFAYFVQDGRQYLIQEFIDGQNLAQELGQFGCYGEAQIRHLLLDLLPVLQFCHDRNVIHRDIKPDNIIRRRQLPGRSTQISPSASGNLVLVDFGASKSADGILANQPGTSIGSPEYVAPEQIHGKAGFYSDIYSLGVTCIHLLTGKSPFDLHDIHNDTWIWQKYLQQPISDDLAAILHQMLARTPIHRYQSAAAVMADLQEYQVVKPQTFLQKPVTPAANNPSYSSISQRQTDIEEELAEIKTTFLGQKSIQSGINTGNQSSNGGLGSSSNSPGASHQSQIDDELEELRNTYLGNND